ncbi:MAG: RNA polymerase sigma factor [Opitutaceae bacterium]
MTDDSFDLPGCLAQVRAGDQAASRDLVNHLYPLVIKIVRSHLPRRAAEEDLAQDIFIKMFNRMHQYHGAVPFPHWVSRIAVTTCIDQLRSQKRRPEFRMADFSEDEARLIENLADPSNRPDPVDALAARELVGRLLATLSPKDRTILTLLDLERRSLAEIASMTGWNTTLIKVRAFRARKKLQKAFEQLKEKESHE